MPRHARLTAVYVGLGQAAVVVPVGRISRKGHIPTTGRAIPGHRVALALWCAGVGRRVEALTVARPIAALVGTRLDPHADDRLALVGSGAREAVDLTAQPFVTLPCPILELDHH